MGAESPRARHLRVKYGITERDYAGMLAVQGGLCAICKKPPKEGRNLQCDHDHKSGELRGLLCFWDNKFLNYGWTPERLRAAADYLENAHTGLFVPERKRKRKKLTKD